MTKNSLFWTGVGASAAAFAGIAVVFALVTSIHNARFNKIELSKKPIANTAVIQAKKGKFAATTSSSSPQVGQIVVVTVIASSSNENILGYDVAMQYGDSVKYVSSESLLTDFDIFASDYPDEGKLLLTGAKKLTAQDPTPFAKTPIVSLRFQTLKRGATDLKFLLKENDKTESNMFGMQNVDILGRADDVHLDIK